MDLIEFECGRCIDGYRSRRRDDGEIEIEAMSQRFEPYRPAQFPVLFQMFADTPPTAEDAVNFSSKFGVLGGTGLSINIFNTSLSEFINFQTSLREAIDAATVEDWPRLVELFNSREFGRGRIQSRLTHIPRGKVGLVFVPTNLIQFLWLQFALHVGSDAKLLRCERCNAPFRVGPATGRRETAKFCSNACKVAAFRGRQTNA
jgi:hypothetical protein